MRKNKALKRIKIGTESNESAIWRARFAKDQLSAGGIDSELIIIRPGKNAALAQENSDAAVGRKLEEALLRGDIDMTVHVMKDLPTEQPQGLVIAGVSARLDPADWLLIRQESIVENQLFKLKDNGLVGVSSPLQKAQLLDYRRDAKPVDTEEDIPSRLEKLRRGDYDAVMVSAAELDRLQPDLSGLEVVPTNPREVVTTPAQGVLAYRCCENDTATRRLIREIHHREVSAVTNVERKVLQFFGGNTNFPLGVYCERDAMGHYHVWAAMADAWDQPLQRTRISQSTSHLLAERVVEGLRL